jgi:hypothetical protein
MRKVVSLAFVVLGVGILANFVVSGPRAFAWGWTAVVLGCFAGGLLVWYGILLWRKQLSAVPPKSE